MAKIEEKTRRTAQARTGGRSTRVVEKVLEATAQELGRVGFVAMRVEDVAVLAGVNKTTIYRRWPTKMQLVTATMNGLVKTRVPEPTGDLRTDLRASLLLPFVLTSSEQGLLRFILQERAVPEVAALAQGLRGQLRERRLAMVRAGVRRGQLRAGVNAGLVVDLLTAAVQQALLFGETLSDRDVDRMLELVLAGAAATAKPRRPSND